MTLYNKSAVRVNELGFDSRAEQVVHGDWHPGNMLFWHKPSPRREKSRPLARLAGESAGSSPSSISIR